MSAASTPLTLPDGVQKYAQSPVFTDLATPEKLTKLHDTKDGVWGRLVILSGALDFITPGPPETRRHVKQGGAIIIQPKRPHRVAFCGPVSFQIEFYR